MAAEWRMERCEKPMAEKVCARVYEELDDFAEEVQSTWGDRAYDALDVLDQFLGRLTRVLPFDPEEL